MAKRLISQADLARLAAVSDMAISKACRRKLKPACVGKRVDVDHPAVVEYLAGKGKTPPAVRPPAAEAAPSTPATRPRSAGKRSSGSGAERATWGDAGPKDAENIDEVDELTLAEIARQFGSVRAHIDWLDARKKTVDIKAKELANAELEGKLVPREWVMTHVFGALERMQKQLLQDAPKTIARRLYAMAKSGGSTEEAEKVVREIVSLNLRPAKETAMRAARHKG